MSSSQDRVVFSQWYKPRNDPSTKILNQKHLIYIATRPGAIPNHDCGFGLWGKVEGMSTIENINDLGFARHLIGTASERHTIYRAILSVNHETAQEFGLYHRSEWERVLRTRISVIQKEMHIKNEDFQWMAAMHHEKGHPHVHIVYWDSGAEPKNEFISEERFKELSENVRHSMSAAIVNSAEINAVHTQISETTQQARKQLSAMLQSANLADALNLHHVKPAQQDEIGKRLMELAAELPARGSLKYQYLPPEYKEKLDACLTQILQISDFKKLSKEYEKLNEDITRLYGNSPKLADEYKEAARRKFVKQLGNETLKYLKSVAEELQGQAPPQDVQELMYATGYTVRALLKETPEYAQLLNLLPRHRTPLQTLLEDEEIKRSMNTLTKRLSEDLRVRSKAEGLLKFGDTEGANRKDIYKTLFSAVRATVWDELKYDKGYDAQELRQTAMMGLLQIFRGTSQVKNQMQSQRNLLREKYRNLSETAKRDLRKQREQEGNWEPEV